MRRRIVYTAAQKIANRLAFGGGFGVALGQDEVDTLVIFVFVAVVASDRQAFGFFAASKRRLVDSGIGVFLVNNGIVFGVAFGIGSGGRSR